VTAECDKTKPFHIVVISAPSGTGKTTIVSRLVKESPVKLIKSISVTTRPPRQHEVHGIDYYFVNRQEFEDRLARHEFLEYAEVFSMGYYYGTLLEEIERIRELGGWALLEIDVVGAQIVLSQFSDAITIFITTPSEDEYERRLRARGTESEEVIQKRLATARSELSRASTYKYQVINDDLDRAVSEINGLLLQEYQSHA
jgi:guanylate kinase